MNRFLVFVFAFIAFQCNAQDKNSAQHVSEKLAQRYAASDDYSALLAEPDVNGKLHTLLGAEYQHFFENITENHARIDVIQGTLLLQGSRKGIPIRENAALCIDELRQVHVVIFSNSDMKVYSPANGYRALPFCIRQYVYLELSGKKALNSPPPQGGGEFTFAQIQRQ